VAETVTARVERLYATPTHELALAIALGVCEVCRTGRVKSLVVAEGVERLFESPGTSSAVALCPSRIKQVWKWWKWVRRRHRALRLQSWPVPALDPHISRICKQ